MSDPNDDDDDAAPLPTLDDARVVLKKTWGHPDFRPVQVPAMEAILSGVDVLATMSTGSGKTILFQVPALMRTGVTIVVTPLIALMNDQVANAKAVGIKAECIHSNQSEDAQAKAVSRVERGKAKLLYVSPERLVTKSFRSLLGEIDVSLIAIDEAHSISRDGGSFRPHYRSIPQIYPLCKSRPQVLAVTATATPAVSAEIRQSLEMGDDAVILLGDPTRPNISYDVIAPRYKAEIDTLVQLARPWGGQDGRYLVYTPTRKMTEECAKALSDLGGWPEEEVGFYHAGLKPASRRGEMQAAFKDSRVRIMCCTNAFGMGIDLPDIRAVVHMGIAESLEGYAQEIGRCGRDGLQSRAILLDTEHGRNIRRILHESSYPPWTLYQAVWDLLCAQPCGETLCWTGERIASMVADGIAKRGAPRPFITGSSVNSVLNGLYRNQLVERRDLPPSTTITFNRMRLRREALDGKRAMIAAAMLEEAEQGAQGAVWSITNSEVTERFGMNPVAFKSQLARIGANMETWDVEKTFRMKSTRVDSRAHGQPLSLLLNPAEITAAGAAALARLKAMVDYTRAADRAGCIKNYFTKE